MFILNTLFCVSLSVICMLILVLRKFILLRMLYSTHTAHLHFDGKKTLNQLIESNLFWIVLQEVSDVKNEMNITFLLAYKTDK